MHPTMKRVARGYVATDSAAEEAVGDTWAAVVAGIGRFQGRSALATWLFSILTNQAKRRGSREARIVPFSSVAPARDAGRAEVAVDADRFQHDDDAWPGPFASPPRPWQKPERRLLALEDREQLRRALDRLPERQKIVVSLRDIEGLSSQEVCGLLDVSAENQRVLLHRGRSRLRADLEAYVEEAA